jgi:hypothetical protein
MYIITVTKTHYTKDHLLHGVQRRLGQFSRTGQLSTNHLNMQFLKRKTHYSFNEIENANPN